MKRALALFLSLTVAACLMGGCVSGPGDGETQETQMQTVPAEEGTDLIRLTENYIILGNQNVSAVIDRRTGFVETVENVATGMVNKNPESGCWPFSLEYSPDGSILYESSVAKKTNNTVASQRIYQQDGRDYLELTYDDLVTDGTSANSTGIRAVVTFSLGPEDDYFKFRVALDLTNTQGQVRSLHLLQGGDLRSGDGAEEYLTAPVWGRGTKWKNPMYNNYFLAGKTLAYPGSGSESLEAGWLDLSGKTQGIGVGYIDSPQIVSEFRIESSGSGMDFDIVLFEPKQILGEAVPLTAGEIFTTGDVLVSVHRGSWHALADAYRKEFNATFVKEDGSPDYLTGDTISKTADSIRYLFREIGAVNQVQSSTVAQMWQNVLEDVQATGASIDKSAYWQVGINANTYGSDTPLLAPYNEKLADPGLTFLETYEKYFGSGPESYQGMGGTVIQYSHPFAMATNREELTSLYPQINPYQHKEDWDGGEHWSVCIDNDIVSQLWTDTVVPQAKQALADAVQFDQCSLVQTICNMEGHNHGLDAVSRLSSHIKAINSLAQQVKRELGDDAFIFSEATNDLTCRYVDARQNHWATFAPLWGGEFEYGAIMYTHPQYVYFNANFVLDGLGNTQEFYLQSTVLGGPVLLSDGPATEGKVESVRLADALWDVGDKIGYPHGYRDTLGMETSSYGLFARVYVQGNSVTVVYCTTSTVKEATITVDLEALGFAGKGVHTFTVENMEAFKGDFQTITVE